MEQNIIINESSSDLRTLGRQALTGNWKLAVLGTLIQLLISMPVLIVAIFFDSRFMENIANFYSFLVSAPLTLGYIMFCMSIFRKIQTTPAEVFYGFEHFIKALGLYIMTTLFTLLWLLLFIIPGIIAAYRYAMAFYILADNPEKGVMQCIRESKQMMAGNKWKFFCLQLSFIGWAIACIFTAGIGTLWLTPYMSVSEVAFYEIAKGNLKISRISMQGDLPTGEENQTTQNASPFEPVVLDSKEVKEERKVENPFEEK